MKSPRRRAFTLIETMIVVTILAILFTIAAIAFAGPLRRSRAATDIRQADAIRVMIETYYANPQLIQPLPLTEGTAVPHNTSFTAAEVAKVATVDEILRATRVMDGFPKWSSASGDDDVPGGISFSIANQRWQGIGPLTNTTSDRPTIECRISNPALLPSVAQGANFRPAGVGYSNLPSNVRVFYVRLPNIPEKAAFAFAETLLKGSEAMPTDVSQAVGYGSLAYAAPVDGVTDVYLYITHR